MHSKDRSENGLPPPPALGPAITAASLMINMLALALPLVILQIFDRVVPFQSFATLNLLFLAMVVVLALDFLLRWCRATCLGFHGKHFETETGGHLLTQILRADHTEFEQAAPGVHFDRLNAVSQLRDYYCGQHRLLRIDLQFVAIFILMIGLIGGWLVIVPLTAVLLLLMFRKILERAQAPVFEKRKTLDGRRYSFLIECLSQILSVKVNTMEPQLLRRYELLQKSSVDISERVVWLSGLSQSFGALFSQAAVAAMGLFGGYLVIQDSIGIAELAACMLLNGRTVQPMLKMLGYWVQSENLAAAEKKLQDVAMLPRRPPVSGLPSEMTGKMSVRDASCNSEDNDQPIFDRLTFTAEPGTCIAISDHNGAACATFLHAVLGETGLSTGEISIDDTPAGARVHPRGENGIVCVDQTPVIFSGTILENLTGFQGGDILKRALYYASALGLEKTVHSLPLGYSTKITHGGQIASSQPLLQQIALARALALRPRLLLFNQAANALGRPEVRRLATCLQDIAGHTTIIMHTTDPYLQAIAGQSVSLGNTADRNVEMWRDDARQEQYQSAMPGQASA